MDNTPQLVDSPAQSQGTDTAQLNKQLVHGIAWTAAAKWTTQVFTWASMAIVARLLSPSDFGIMGMAVVYLGIVQIFSEFGFGSAIVVLRDLSRDEIAQINSVAAFTGIAGVIISAALSRPLAQFFHTPQLARV